MSNSREKSTRRRVARVVMTLAVGSLMVIGVAGIQRSVAGEDFDFEEPLSSLEVPLPDLDEYLKPGGRDIAIQLGKAFFWDIQLGSDGQVACATCHFQAGADVREINTINAGRNGVIDTGDGSGRARALDFPITSDDIVGSQGVVDRMFHGIIHGSAVDDCGPALSEDRRVTGRNSPPAVMSIFNPVNFWDGRALGDFNGVTPGGALDAQTILVDDGKGMTPISMSLFPASTASQSVGPPLSDVEVSCAGRTWPDLGRKLFNSGLIPLGQQEIHPEDSVLGSLSRGSRGLSMTYKSMVQAAFLERYWASTEMTDDGFTQMEANTSMFWGIAIMLYEALLVPDDSPFDRWAAGIGTPTASELLGAQVFFGDGDCADCHDGPAFTDGSFEAIGVRPAIEDPGRGEGEFKVPTVRNAELTAPYFHNGGMSTLRQVVEFYNRGGDFGGDLDPLNLTEAEMVGLVDFMLALTDERVRCRIDPFDGPSLPIPNGPTLPAVGAAGTRAACFGTFLGLDPHSGGENDTSHGLGENMIVNGEFDEGRTAWRFFSNGSASMNVGAGEAQVSITTPGTNVQLYQFRLSTEANTTYRLRFRARSNRGDIRVRLINHTTGSNAGLDEFVDLTRLNQEFTVDFTTGSSPIANARLIFWFAPFDQAGDHYFFDDVRLQAHGVSSGDGDGDGGDGDGDGGDGDGGDGDGGDGDGGDGDGDGGDPGDPGPNQLVNGDFSRGKRPWRFYTNSAASFAVVDRAGKITITAPGSNIQLYQFDIPVKGNTNYRVGFRGKSNSGNDVRLRLINHETGESLGLSQKFNVRTTERTQYAEFTTPPGDVDNARLIFWLAPYAQAGDVYDIDDVVLEELIPVARSVARER